MEQAQQSSYRATRTARAEQLRDYFDLQLCFAEAVAATGVLSLADAVLQCTNFYRRFGFGYGHDVAVSPEWTSYATSLVALETHAQRLAWTQTFFIQAPPESPLADRRPFGCFACDPPDAEGRVRIHFTNTDTDGISPLSQSKIAARRQDLRALFTYVQHTHTEAQTVQGGSWLYNLAAYRRLFPAVYGDSRTVLTGMEHFRGTSRWGQFLDHRERVKPAPRAQFLENLNRLEPQRLWAVFPLLTYATQAPIQAFYDFYDMAG